MTMKVVDDAIIEYWSAEHRRQSINNLEEEAYLLDDEGGKLWSEEALSAAKFVGWLSPGGSVEWFQFLGWLLTRKDTIPGYSSMAGEMAGVIVTRPRMVGTYRS
jgi:hypothetical protein